MTPTTRRPNSFAAPRAWAPPPAPRMLNGAAMTDAAETVARQRNRDAWPYVHVYPPPDSIPVHQIGVIAGPAAGSPNLVLEYLVPSGHRFFLRSILQVYSGAAFLPGDATWTVDQDQPIGISDLQGMSIQGLVDVPVPLGSITSGNQWPLPRAYEFAPLTIVRSKVTAVNTVGGFFVSGFFGYLVPELLAEK